MRVLRVVLAASCLAVASPAVAQIDMTGTWEVRYGNYPDIAVTETTFSQNGTVLTSPNFGTGTINPSTGSFQVESGSPLTSSRLYGTVVPDGSYFEGTYEVSGFRPPGIPTTYFFDAVGFRLTGPPTTTTTLTPGQSILGKSLLVKDPKPGTDPSKRKIVGSAKERNSDSTLVGDPTLTGTAGGAVLQIVANGANPSAQEFVLPQGTNADGKPFWSGSAVNGFKYKDRKGEQGPVTSAGIKRSSGGTFSIKAVVTGKNGAVSVVPPNPGTDGCMALDLGIDPAAPGDRYSVLFGSDSTIKIVGAKLFKASKPIQKGDCPSAPTTTTTTTAAPSTTTFTTSTTTTTTLSGSPSPAFLARTIDLVAVRAG